MVDVPVLLLALEDFIPVALFAIALGGLARLCYGIDLAAGRATAAGAVFIPVGGLSKPLYETVLALSGRKAGSCHPGGRAVLVPGTRVAAAGARWGPSVAVVTVAGAVLLAGLGADPWFFLLLTIATLGNLLAVVALVRWGTGEARTRSRRALLGQPCDRVRAGLGGGVPGTDDRGAMG